MLFGVPIHPMTMAEATDWCVASTLGGHRATVGVVNVAKMVWIRADPQIRSALLDCDLVLADGQGVVLASRLLRRPLPERVAGIDLFFRLMDEADRLGLRVYFLGAKQEVLERMLARVAERWPRAVVVGARDGYFKDEENAEVAERIRGAQPDLLFAGMSSPKKELFLQRFGSQAVPGVCHGVGGSFDILAGITRRAPLLWQRAGLEWLYRVVQEPRRMWRRYLDTNSRFAVHLLRELRRPTPPYRLPLLGADARPAPTGRRNHRRPVH
ncbi:WecB/TagA/CpsF family glycosyltransferase [Frankia sp. CNm7]|nr:WecB/TagA/CpsF family glycosyltransferase [Frankia nepalensis]MBL7512783.1 WecB/TagA/CpsF family glycosyltransferase [Frankia nepalensis]MBL7522003.1 WecB/TagA/CpsF family glycosyltransferase [Frankia nepalensis]